MRTVRVAIEYDDALIHPMHEFVCESTAVDREVLLEGRVVDGTRTLLFYVEGDRDAYEAALERRLAPDAHEVTAEADEGFYLYVRGPNRAVEAELFAAFDRESVVVVPPIGFHDDRTMRLTLVGPGEEIRAAFADLPDGLTLDVKRVGGYADRFESAVTATQRAALETAWRLGYYEVPRECGIEAVAAELDRSVSTVSTLLRRAERELVGNALGTRW